MLTIELRRDAPQPAPHECTLGVMRVNGRAWQTMEKPWVPSADGPCGTPSISCIAPGVYRVESRETEARGKHWLLSNAALGLYRYPQNIPAGAYGRSLVLIHAANWAHELLGCIAPGKTRAIDGAGGWMVTRSRDAMNEIRTMIGNRIDVQIEITGGA